jgi:putative resolvase
LRRESEEWARAQGIHVTSAYRWYREGQMPVPARKVGRLILVSPETVAAPPAGGGGGLYARVSCPDQEADLGRPVARLTAWAERAGLPVVRVEAEVGSGVNGVRAKARRCWPTRRPPWSWWSTATASAG